MYEFSKLPDEEIKIISDESLLKHDDMFKNISTIVTNKRIILLDYPSASNNYQEALRTSRGVDYLPKKEVILESNLDNIIKIEKCNDYDKYILLNGTYFYLKDKEVKSVIKTIIT